MCTVTVLPLDNGFILTMNRDELRGREEEGLRYGICSRAGDHQAEFCYPVDKAQGGSWVGLNTHGVAMCLLNRYQAPTIENARSRGHIITSALEHGSLAQVEPYLRTLDTSHYNAFDCLLISPEGFFSFSWDRVNYTCKSMELGDGVMLTSSSERLSEVTKYRKNRFTSWRQAGYNPIEIDSFHLEQQDQMARSAMLMSRELTHTKSLTQIRVKNGFCQLSYYDESKLRANGRLSSQEPTDSFEAHRVEPNFDLLTNLQQPALEQTKPI